MIIMAIILICVEVEQMLTRTGGIDVDDVILNLTGAVIFFALWRLDASQELLKKLYIVEK
ncbi:VanZ family protein [Caldicoprobacter algeriensis]|uniref:VanZ family protein n=1 Tax=Caldicoprobacter algeriensis TaxID=699281 RepID=UPI003B848C25